MRADHVVALEALLGRQRRVLETDGALPRLLEPRDLFLDAFRRPVAELAVELVAPAADCERRIGGEGTPR